MKRNRVIIAAAAMVLALMPLAACSGGDAADGGVTKVQPLETDNVTACKVLFNDPQDLYDVGDSLGTGSVTVMVSDEQAELLLAVDRRFDHAEDYADAWFAGEMASLREPFDRFSEQDGLGVRVFEWDGGQYVTDLMYMIGVCDGLGYEAPDE